MQLRLIDEDIDLCTGWWSMRSCQSAFNVTKYFQVELGAIKSPCLWRQFKTTLAGWWGPPAQDLVDPYWWSDCSLSRFAHLRKGKGMWQCSRFRLREWSNSYEVCRYLLPVSHSRKGWRFCSVLRRGSQLAVLNQLIGSSGACDLMPEVLKAKDRGARTNSHV